ncbi:arrestin domain-containing protein 15-like [Sitodiplosis mosellana]|uniref:arrestin domain-containing protein 15-like n=1 Tax=Sitodiplosis mosellana TaxID=263140 RepID=UPI002444CF72|nr:arrestin domain-containing protein 15-like [Sitodiplosis mosellana]
MGILCEILFDKNPKRIFYTGQSLHGSIRITLKNDKYVRGIFVKINGAAITICKADNFGEDCLNDRLEIIGDTRLAAGTHEFPFQFKIPTQLPSSYEGEYGFIRYMVTVSVDIPKIPRKEFEKRIIILRLTDLKDTELQRQVAVTGRFNPYFVCSCLPWFPLKIDAYIDHTAYAPGSNIELEINVTNRSFCKIHGFEAQLIKEVTYVPVLQSIEILKEVKLRGCLQNHKYTVCFGCFIEVPPTSATNLISKVIKIRHFIRITALMRKKCRPVIEVPVTIVTASENQR